MNLIKMILGKKASKSKGCCDVKIQEVKEETGKSCGDKPLIKSD